MMYYYYFIVINFDKFLILIITKLELTIIIYSAEFQAVFTTLNSKENFFYVSLNEKSLQE